MLPRPYRQMTTTDREAWEIMLAAPALTEVGEATDLMSMDRLEVLHARPALFDLLAAEFPERWALQRYDPLAFQDAWVEASEAFDRGDFRLVPDLLVDAAIYECRCGDASTAVELLVWAALYRVGNLLTADQSFFQPP